MILPFEALLCLGILAFYVYDSASLLYRNEFLLIRKKSGINLWLAHNGPVMMRRYLHVPNPMTPTLHVYRSAKIANTPFTTDHKWCLFTATECIAQMLDIWVVFLAFELLVFLPIIAFIWGSGPELLMVFIVIYGTIIVAFLMVYRFRHIMAHMGIGYYSLFFECILCPPFSINLIRKICGSCYIPDYAEFIRDFDGQGADKLIGILYYQYGSGKPVSCGGESEAIDLEQRPVSGLDRNDEL